ncbi:unnamed protein product [Trifolium pratense]|uniref:Uncharacterized protein n=1 Tax=Trifolium pratense TaxID=57577 RepID=A0ACB0LK24_TRIPR|nr:unnamed protein product [Trifolium pratense]
MYQELLRTQITHALQDKKERNCSSTEGGEKKQKLRYSARNGELKIVAATCDTCWLLEIHGSSFFFSFVDFD